MSTESETLSAREATNRREAVIDAALAVLAGRGARGFTHREVDRVLSLPLGSTSNYFRRRSDLFLAVADRILQVDMTDAKVVEERIMAHGEPSPALVADVFTDLFASWFHPDNRARSVARMEILFESYRNADLKQKTNSATLTANQFHQILFSGLGAKNPSRSAELFTSLFSGLHVLIVTGPDNIERPILHALFEHYIDICMKAGEKE